MKIKYFSFMVFAMVMTGLSIIAEPARADEAEDLAKKLANPVASLISVPIQANYDQDIGPNEDGSVTIIGI
jgi:hypothetical protein